MDRELRLAWRKACPSVQHAAKNYTGPGYGVRKQERAGNPEGNESRNVSEKKGISIYDRPIKDLENEDGGDFRPQEVRAKTNPREL